MKRSKDKTLLFPLPSFSSCSCFEIHLRMGDLTFSRFLKALAKYKGTLHYNTIKKLWGTLEELDMCPKSPVLGHLCDWSCVTTRRVCSLLLLTVLQLVRQVFFFPGLSFRLIALSFIWPLFLRSNLAERCFAAHRVTGRETKKECASWKKNLCLKWKEAFFSFLNGTRA